MVGSAVRDKWSRQPVSIRPRIGSNPPTSTSAALSSYSRSPLGVTNGDSFAPQARQESPRRSHRGPGRQPWLRWAGNLGEQLGGIRWRDTKGDGCAQNPIAAGQRNRARGCGGVGLFHHHRSALVGPALSVGLGLSFGFGSLFMLIRPANAASPARAVLAAQRRLAGDTQSGNVPVAHAQAPVATGEVVIRPVGTSERGEESGIAGIGVADGIGDASGSGDAGGIGAAGGLGDSAGLDMPARRPPIALGLPPSRTQSWSASSGVTSAERSPASTGSFNATASLYRASFTFIARSTAGFRQRLAGMFLVRPGARFSR